MRILVTGHAGYIGTVLVPLLQGRGHDVHGLDSDLYGLCNFRRAPAPVANILGDIRDVTVKEMEGFEAVVHLAGLSNDPLGDLDPDLTYEINYRASVRLAKLAKRARVKRFVVSSSCSAYGAAGDELLNESSQLNPVTPYGHSKVMSERDISILADGEFSPIFLRSATLYGDSPRLRFDLVVNNLVAWACATGNIHFKSDGSAWRPLVHVADVSRAIAAVLEAPRERVHGEIFNVGRSEENYRVRDLASIVADVVPNTKVAFAQGASVDTRNYRVDCTKYEAAFPDAPLTWNVAQGVREVYAALSPAPVKVEEFEGPRYSRLAHLRWLMDGGFVDASLRSVVRQAVPA